MKRIMSLLKPEKWEAGCGSHIHQCNLVVRKRMKIKECIQNRRTKIMALDNIIRGLEARKRGLRRQIETFKKKDAAALKVYQAKHKELQKEHARRKRVKVIKERDRIIKKLNI